MTTEEPTTDETVGAEPTAPPEPKWMTCKTHDVKWDENDEEGKKEKLNHSDVYGCEVVDGEHTTQDEEDAANQSAAAEATSDVEESSSKSKSKSPYGSK